MGLSELDLLKLWKVSWRRWWWYYMRL
jgi:hypothetical protein